MKNKHLFEESVQALRSNFLRSLLTVIGIVVGIFSVTAMLALGEGLSQNVLSRFNSFAQGDITVTGDISYNDFKWIGEQPYTKYEIGNRRLTGASVVALGNDYSPTVQSIVGDYADIAQFKVDAGTAFDFKDVNYADDVVLVSNGFATKVETDTGQSVLGQTITISNVPFKVAGVISSNSLQYTQGDGIIFVPYAAALGTLTNATNFSSVAVMLQDSSYYDVIGTSVLAGLNASRDLAPDSTDVFSVETAQAFIQTAQETTSMITLFLGIVGSIALFVGGIGTMNMMLTTVTERTREIGLRKAIGARDRDILLQILLESVLLTTFGGIIGILITLGVAKIANTLLAGSSVISVIVNMKVVALAFAVAVIVGVLFGVYPARNASRLQPVDALRTE